MTKTNANPENDFSIFLAKYFNKTSIKRHKVFQIVKDGKSKIVKPDFFINAPQQYLFEFKELKEPDDPDSHLGRRLDFFNRPAEEPISQFMRSISPYIRNKIFEAADQLKPVEELKCPAVLVLHSGVPGICCEFDDGTFMEVMYLSAHKDESARSPVEVHPHISAVANFMFDLKGNYLINFYHNKFAPCKLPYKSFAGKESKHYQINDYLEWMAVIE